MYTESFDFIIISQSEVVNYEEYSKLPLDRLDLYINLIYPRMLHYKGGFRAHLDVLNDLKHGKFWADASPEERRALMSIWNLPGFVGPHIANYLKKYDVNTCVINNIDAEWDWFCEAYENSNPKPLVGISTTFNLNYSEIARLTKRMKKTFPDIELALGGAFVNGAMLKNNHAPLSKAMKKFGIDYAVHSFNSEKDLKDLVLHHKNKQSNLTEVNNLVYLSGNNGDRIGKVTEIVWNNPLLNETPTYWHELNLPFLNHTIQMRTSSGCPFSCAFCSYPETAGGFFTMPVETVEKHIKSVLKIQKVKNIIFLDDTFNMPVRRFKDLCRMFAKYDFEWFSFLRVQYVDEEVAQLMKESGCRGVYLGMESANDQVLKNMNKKATRVDFLKGAQWLKRYDITMMVAFVVGFPGETEATLQDNVDFIEQNDIEFYSLKEFYYMENTPIYKKRHEFGLDGMGNKWTHDTMNSEEASQWKLELTKRIKSCSIDPDTSLWYLAYLYDQGYSMEEIKSLQDDINTLMIDQMNGKFDDESPIYSRLRTKLQTYGQNDEIPYKEKIRIKTNVPLSV